jgi:hypothetical protein
MLNLCGIVVAILKMATARNFSMSGIYSGHHNLPTYEMSLKSDNVEFVWWPFWKWRPVGIFQCQDIIIYSGHHNLPTYEMSLKSDNVENYLPTYQILMISENVESLPPIFYAMFWQPFWKWHTSWKFWKRRIAPLMVTYHYVKLYVSIIIHLEVININVRNFNFPIRFYSNPHPLWTPQNMTLSPFTTKLKTLGPTRNIYL